MDLSPAADPSPAFPVALPPHAHLAPDGRVHLRADVEIREVREEGGYALAEGIAYPALVVADGGKVAAADAFRIDTYKTWMAPETLRTFAHRFLERGTGGIDSQHDHGNVGLIVESWYQREATERYPANVWVAVVKVLKADAIEGLRAKTLRGFSIEFVGKYRDAPLDIEGIGKVRTAEIVDPYPITLSLVSKPATRLPFAEIAQRAEGEAPADPAQAPAPAPAARAENDADEEPGRAVLVRFDPPDEGTGDSTVTIKTPAGAARTEAPAADPTPAAVRAEGTTPAAPAAEANGAAAVVVAPVAAEPAAEPAARTAAAPSMRAAPTMGDLRPEFRALVLRALGEPAARAALPAGDLAKRSCDWSDLASVLAEYDAKWTFNDAVWRYLYAAQSVFYECGYCAEDDAQVATMVRKMAADLMAAINGACDELEASAMARSTRSATDATAAMVAARAGKTLSKKNRERVAGAHDAADSCRSMLKELLDETGDGEAEGEGDAQACSERAAPAAPAQVSDDVLAALRAEHAAEVAKLRAELDAKSTELTAVTKRADDTTGALAAAEKRVAALHDEKAAADAARAAAEKRVADLESARPSPKGTTDAPAAPAAPAARATNPAAPGAAPAAPSWGLNLRAFAPGAAALPVHTNPAVDSDG